ncbi:MULTISPECIES: hypothetical protein [unclassified Ensifer]|uniref:hypothetical protein n=1 Tax=unclassified Ensifer TaxID=2633371 RepID=UPI0012E397B1|nr:MULTISPECIES: hypothetical protein [unclassified Ensifer]
MTHRQPSVGHFSTQDCKAMRNYNDGASFFYVATTERLGEEFRRGRGRRAGECHERNQQEPGILALVSDL